MYGADVGGSEGVRGLSVEPPKLKEMRHYNTPALPQNAGKPIYKNLNFKTFPGEGAHQPPKGNRLAGPYLELPSLKSCIHPSWEPKERKERKIGKHQAGGIKYDKIKKQLSLVLL